jgi:hypothetical protein
MPGVSAMLLGTSDGFVVTKSLSVKELLAKTLQRRKAEITLCTDEVIVLYWRPLTEAEDEAIRESVSQDAKSNAYTYRVLIDKAENEDGSKMFTVRDLPAMRREYAKKDLEKMMEQILFNGGILAKVDSKSSSGGAEE